MLYLATFSFAGVKLFGNLTLLALRQFRDIVIKKLTERRSGGCINPIPFRDFFVHPHRRRHGVFYRSYRNGVKLFVKINASPGVNTKYRPSFLLINRRIPGNLTPLGSNCIMP